MITNNVWKFLYHYAKQMKWLFIALFGLLIFGRVFDNIQRWAVAKVVEAVTKFDFAQPNFHNILKYFGFYALCIPVLAAYTFLRRYIAEVKLIPFYTLKVSQDLFCITHKHSSRFFAQEMPGNISAKVKEICGKLESFYMHCFFGILEPAVATITSLCFVAYVDVYLGVSFLVMALIFMALTIWLKSKLSVYAQYRAKTGSESQGFLVDSIANADLVKSFSRYFSEKLNYFKTLKKHAKARSQEAKKFLSLDTLSRFVFDIMDLSFMAMTLYFWYKSSLSVADLVFVFSAISIFVNAQRNIGFMASNFANIYGSIKDGLDLLSAPIEVKDHEHAKELKIKTADIEFKNMYYSYSDNIRLFEDFNLHVSAGEKVGIVGCSGSGKSTLIKLLCRYYDLQHGNILINGQDISRVTQNSLRKHIAVVPQDCSLFNRTIMENIRYGKFKATDEQVIEASKKAYCHNFIMKTPHGYQSKVGERGVMLSGGERQRISIARVILKDAPILILDEATSALDTQSEQYIQRSIKSLMKGKTVIAIAHRLSTLNQMDRIVVIDNGKIIEQGSNEELLRKKGVYYKLYKTQSAGFIKESVAKDKS